MADRAIHRNEEPFETVERHSLSQQAYRQLRKALRAGEFTPGQKLNGRDIALRVGTSLTPVREALQQLVAEGALESRPGQPITVPIATRAAFAELSDVRVQVEGLGAERAAATIDAKGIADLAEIHAALVKAKAEHAYGEAMRWNEAFHLELCREARMPRLFRVVESLWVQNGPFLNFLHDDPEGWPVRADPHAHVQVLDALKRRDGEAARRAIVEDILGGGAALMLRLPE